MKVLLKIAVVLLIICVATIIWIVSSFLRGGVHDEIQHELTSRANRVSSFQENGVLTASPVDEYCRIIDKVDRIDPCKSSTALRLNRHSVQCPSFATRVYLKGSIWSGYSFEAYTLGAPPIENPAHNFNAPPREALLPHPRFSMPNFPKYIVFEETSDAFCGNFQVIVSKGTYK